MSTVLKNWMWSARNYIEVHARCFVRYPDLNCKAVNRQLLWFTLSHICMQSFTRLTMSKLAEFRQLEKHLAEQLQALEALKGDAGLKKEIEFETKLRALLAEYGYSLQNVINLLDPQAGRRAPAAESKSGTRKPRQVKLYKNPNTGEIIETKGGNHKGLKEWKAEHGSDTIESWLTK